MMADRSLSYGISICYETHAKVVIFNNVCNKFSTFVPKSMVIHLIYSCTSVRSLGRALCGVATGLLMLQLVACAEPKRQEVTPWGSVVGEDSVEAQGSFSLADIVSGGELIMLTLSGPESYYDYHGRGMGLQYLLCERFAQDLGVSLRVEVCRDTTDMVARLKRGEGDLIAFQLPRSLGGISFAGARVDEKHTAWAVKQGNEELADTLNRWFRPQLVAEVRKQESFYLSTRSVTRHVYSPMLNRSAGIISPYDRFFQMYAPAARWDWRLMAAQCYQESTFDPRARSWAGACGLMQIMPGTAAHLGLPMSQMFDPESNIAAAAKYIRELSGLYTDVPPSERIAFVLASYNGGHFHIRDAMALARKEGRSGSRWAEVREYVLRLSSPAYYNDPVVRHGYMRGSETVDYVDRILSRWAQYRGVARGGSYAVPSMPERSRRGNRWRI